MLSLAIGRQHNVKKDIFKVETKLILWCLLFVYCKQVYATCFDFYLSHHQANSIKHKLSYLNFTYSSLNVSSIMQQSMILIVAL
jgi:hypothetical protein